MKLTKNISIAGIGFSFDEDAYAALEAYITKLHRAYDSDPNGTEIIADIEGRIAELILAEQTHRQVVSLDKINAIIAQLGTPEVNNTPHSTAKSTSSKESQDSGNTPTAQSKHSSVLMIILRIVAGLIGAWMSFSWATCAVMLIILDVTQFGAELIIWPTADTPLIFKLLFGLISLPWLLTIFALFMFAFGKRIRGWAIGALVALLVAVLLIPTININVKNHTTIPTISHNTKLLEYIDNIKERIDNFDDNALLEKLDDLELEDVSDINYYSYTEPAINDSDSIIHHIIEGKNEKNGNIRILVDVNRYHTDTPPVIATISYCIPNAAPVYRQFSFGPFKLSKHISTVPIGPFPARQNVVEVDVTR